VTTREAVCLTAEISDGDRNPVGAGAGDFDGKLRLGKLLRSTAQKPGKFCGKFWALSSFSISSRDFTLQTVCI
jgi:hypothetical protein